MNKEPLISICIPAYNRADLLPALLKSILDQDFDDYDIVISEDFSPERQAISDKVRVYRHQYGNRLKYYENNQTLGYDGNLRRLVDLATGQYILFMGNDDLLAPGALREVANAVQQHSTVGVILRSYSSFVNNPAFPVQVFRYFDGDRVFPPGPDTVVTFFRRSVFISGMVFKRRSAANYATPKYDGSLLYQQHLVGKILMIESGIYLHHIISYHRLGGVPDFGASSSERGLFVPKQQTPESSVQFIRGMLNIARSLDQSDTPNLSKYILRDIGNYAYPILSIQADNPPQLFIRYLWQLMQLGLWRVPLFYVYAFGLLMLGRANCDFLISQIKQKLGRAPVFGTVYTGIKCSSGSR